MGEQRRHDERGRSRPASPLVAAGASALEEEEHSTPASFLFHWRAGVCEHRCKGMGMARASILNECEGAKQRCGHRAIRMLTSHCLSNIVQTSQLKALKPSNWH